MGSPACPVMVRAPAAAFTPGALGRFVKIQLRMQVVLRSAHCGRHGFVVERAADRRMQVERLLDDLSDADVVVDVLLEVADRRVAAFGVIPLEREVDVGRLQRLQGRIALRTGAAVDAHQQVEHLAALDVAPTRTADGLAPAGAELQVVRDARWRSRSSAARSRSRPPGSWWWKLPAGMTTFNSLSEAQLIPVGDGTSALDVTSVCS